MVLIQGLIDCWTFADFFQHAASPSLTVRTGNVFPQVGDVTKMMTVEMGRMRQIVVSKIPSWSRPTHSSTLLFISMLGLRPNWQRWQWANTHRNANSFHSFHLSMQNRCWQPLQYHLMITFAWSLEAVKKWFSYWLPGYVSSDISLITIHSVSSV